MVNRMSFWYCVTRDRLGIVFIAQIACLCFVYIEYEFGVYSLVGTHTCVHM
jgi:hypothetical protein